MDLTAPDGTILFGHNELACRQTGQVVLAPGFGEKLVELRLAWAKPMRVNSCCRSYERNRAVGGHPNSLHVYDLPAHRVGGTCAIDIAVGNPQDMLALAQLAIAQGWSIGVAKSFLHLDRRDLCGLSQGLFGY